MKCEYKDCRCQATGRVFGKETKETIVNLCHKHIETVRGELKYDSTV